MTLIIIHSYKLDFTRETIIFLSTTPDYLQTCLPFSNRIMVGTLRT